MSPSRRIAIRLSGAALATTLAGCSVSTLLGEDVRYSIMSRPRGGTTLEDLFAWEPSGGQLHVREHGEDLAAELLETGRLVTEAQPIGPYDPDGQPPPAYAEHDGAYYRVRVTDVEDVSLDRWEFWFEPVEGAPAGVDPVEEPTEGRSALDSAIIERAIGDAIGAVVADEDPGAAPHGERGVVFFDPLDPDDSDLVPEPPFEYVRVDPDTEFLDEAQTLRAHADAGTVDARRYVHETERVADSRERLRAILADHVDASFARGGEGVDVVASITDGGSYSERAPLSESFERLLDRLGSDDPSAPAQGADARTWRRSFEFAGDYYHATVRARSG